MKTNHALGFFGVLGACLSLIGCTASEFTKTVKNLGLDEVVTLSDFTPRNSLLVQAFGTGEDWFTPGEEALAQKALQNNKDHEGTLWNNHYKGNLTLYPVATSESGRCRRYVIEYFVVSMGITKEHVFNMACYDAVNQVWVPQTIKKGPSNSAGVRPVTKPLFK